MVCVCVCVLSCQLGSHLTGSTVECGPCCAERGAGARDHATQMAKLTLERSRESAHAPEPHGRQPQQHRSHDTRNTAAAHAALTSAQQACAEERRAVEAASLLARQMLHVQVAGSAMADLRADSAAQQRGTVVRTEAHVQPRDGSCRGGTAVAAEAPRYLQWKRDLEATVQTAQDRSDAAKLHLTMQLEVAAARWHARRMHPETWPGVAPLLDVDLACLPNYTGPVPSAAQLAASLRVSARPPPAPPAAPDVSVPAATQPQSARSRTSASASPRRCLSPEAELWQVTKRARARAGVFRLLQPAAQSWDASTAPPTRARRARPSRSAESPLPRRDATVRAVTATSRLQALSLRKMHVHSMAMHDRRISARLYASPRRDREHARLQVYLGPSSRREAVATPAGSLANVPASSLRHPERLGFAVRTPSARRSMAAAPQITPVDAEACNSSSDAPADTSSLQEVGDRPLLGRNAQAAERADDQQHASVVDEPSGLPSTASAALCRAPNADKSALRGSETGALPVSCASAETSHMAGGADAPRGEVSRTGTCTSDKPSNTAPLPVRAGSLSRALRSLWRDDAVGSGKSWAHRTFGRAQKESLEQPHSATPPARVLSPGRGTARKGHTGQCAYRSEQAMARILARHKGDASPTGHVAAQLELAADAMVWEVDRAFLAMQADERLTHFGSLQGSQASAHVTRDSAQR